MMNLWLRKNADHRLYYGKYLCRDWNAKHLEDESLETFQIIFVKERTLKNTIADPERVNIWNHNCFE